MIFRGFAPRVAPVILASLLLFGSAPAAAVEPSLRPSADTEPRVAGGEDAPAYATDRVVVRWRDPGKAAHLQEAHGLTRIADLGDPGRATLLATRGRPVDEVLAELASDPAVAYAEPDYVIQLAEEVSTAVVSVDDPYTADQYSLDRMRVRDAWSIETGGSNIVAVLDTGVSYVHPDLSGRVLRGYDFVNTDSDARDDNGHGTWVAGIIAANTNNGIGVAGISWSDKILPVKIMNSAGTGHTSDLTAGIIWAADQGADVINMSVGGFPYLQQVRDAIDYAWAKGAVLVGAAGNNRREELFYPASYPNVISVSATQADDEFTNWSSYGSAVDVSAPGAWVMTTDCGGCSPSSAGSPTYVGISGTSFAAPNTAGVVALIRARYPSYTNAQVVDRLIRTVDDRGYLGRDNRYGHGRVNAFRAVGGSPAWIPIPPGDAFEPNNDVGHARAIALNTTHRPNIYPAGDVDVVAVDAPRAGRLEVVVTPVVDTARALKSSLPVDPVVELLDRYGTVLVRVDNPNDSAATETATYEVVGATRVLIRVSNWFPNGNRVAYSITARFTDNVPPRVTSRVPAVGSANEPLYPLASLTFSEPVTGVSDTTFTLKDASTGSGVPATVAYDVARRVATLRPHALLVAGRAYTLSVSGEIRDLSGAPLRAESWTFNTVGGEAYVPPRAARFRAGTHTGYRFAAAGSVVARRPYNLAAASSASVSQRGRLPNQPGRWLYVENGVWAGHWLAESSAVGIGGIVESVTYDPARGIRFAAGAHTGYRFDAAGRVVGTRTASLSRASSASASGRAIINGVPHSAVADGIWAGYWIPESSVAFIPGTIESMGFNPLRAVSFSATTHTGYQFDSAGNVLASKSYRLGAASSASASSWAIINGRAHVLISNGIWAGYWMPLSASVAIVF